MVLPALEYGLDPGGLVHVPVVLADGAGSAVDDDVNLPEHVADGAVNRNAGLGERLDALLGDIEPVSLGNGVPGLVVGPGLGDPNELHVRLLGDGRGDPLPYRAVTVDTDPDLRHLIYLDRANVGALISVIEGWGRRACARERA